LENPLEQTLSWPLTAVGLRVAPCLSAGPTDSVGDHLAGLCYFAEGHTNRRVNWLMNWQARGF